MKREVWLVQRVGVDERHSLASQTEMPAFQPYMPVRLFTDRGEAEAFRGELERAARRALSPFNLFPLAAARRSSDPDESVELLSLLADLGMPLPEPKTFRHNESIGQYVDWAEWWKANARGLTEEQIDRIWDLFDASELARVVPMTIEA